MVQISTVMPHTSDSIRFVSYNCRGWNTGSFLLCDNFLKDVDICLIQEHWLLRDQLHILNNHNPEFTSFGVSGIDCSRLLQGRPYGSCGFLICKSLLPRITFIDFDAHVFVQLSLTRIILLL